LIAGRNVGLVLQRSVTVEAKVLAVEPDALRVRVTSTSDEKILKTGKTEIPRSSVSLIRMTKLSKRWRAILTPAVPGVALLGISVVSSSVYPKPAPIKLGEIALGVAAAVAGYFIAQHLDTRECIQITLLRD
jgi:hypothetical protein